jgi:hypothetical protein
MSLAIRTASRAAGVVAVAALGIGVAASPAAAAG